MSAQSQRFLAAVRRRRKMVIVAVVLLIVAVVVLMRRGDSAIEEPAAEVTVQTAVAVVKPLTASIQALGTVQPRSGRAAEISAPESSPVLAVFVGVGDRVRAGQPLVQLDKAVFASRRHEAEVALNTAQQAYNRAQRLLKDGISPRKDVETAAAELAKARADLEQATRTEALSTLRSPINGVVTELHAALSSPVDVTLPVVEVVDPSGLEILFHLSPGDAGQITPGSKVALSSGQDAGRHSVGIGTITGVSAAVDSTTGSVDVRATIAAPTRPLKAGETLSGRIELPSRRTSVVVPIEALVPDGEATQVFVVDANGIAHATPVTVGTRTETEAEILSGLKGGETVVTQGAYGVADSSHVKTGAVR